MLRERRPPKRHDGFMMALGCCVVGEEKLRSRKAGAKFTSPAPHGRARPNIGDTAHRAPEYSFNVYNINHTQNPSD
jgi:hypothetical protein